MNVFPSHLVSWFLALYVQTTLFGESLARQQVLNMGFPTELFQTQFLSSTSSTTDILLVTRVIQQTIIHELMTLFLLYEDVLKT